MIRLIPGLLLAALLTAAAPRWEIQYFYDEAKSSLHLTDIVFPTAKRGLASGVITEGTRVKSVVLITSDGGAHWTHVSVSEPGVSLFCVDETACWMVTDRGVWFSDEAGRTWRKISKEQGILGVTFVSREHGWIYGARRKLLETKDGGKTWNAVPEAAKLNTSAERTVFYTLRFFNDKAGILTGRSEPPTRRPELPIWADTEPELQRERPTLTTMLATRDGGATWIPSTTSIFGRFSRLSKPSATGLALGLVEFDRFFQFGSEVYRYDFAAGNMIRTFREGDVTTTDVGVTRSGLGVLAGFENVGRVIRTPVPGKLKVYLSMDLQKWTASDVDYRAVAKRARVAVVDEDNIWIATDTGMVLKLVR
jgi:hypothetical protein